MWAPTPNHTCFHAPLSSPSSHFQKKTLPSPAPGRQRSHLEGTCSPTHTCTCLKPEASTWRARVCPHTGSSLSPSWDPPPAPPGRASFSDVPSLLHSLTAGLPLSKQKCAPYSCSQCPSSEQMLTVTMCQDSSVLAPPVLQGPQGTVDVTLTLPQEARTGEPGDTQIRPGLSPGTRVPHKSDHS